MKKEKTFFRVPGLVVLVAVNRWKTEYDWNILKLKFQAPGQNLAKGTFLQQEQPPY